jgi:hypothetical protein
MPCCLFGVGLVPTQSADALGWEAQADSIAAPGGNEAGELTPHPSRGG